MSNFVYIARPQSDLFTVGFYTPDGTFQPDQGFKERDEAIKRMRYLNGASDDSEIRRLSEIIKNTNILLAKHASEVKALRAQLEEEKKATEAARDDAERYRKCWETADINEKAAALNRDRFCASINRIAKMVGMNVENAAFEAVERNVQALVEQTTLHAGLAESHKRGLFHVAKQLGLAIGLMDCDGIAYISKEIEKLLDWKREMIAVDSQCDWQKLSKLLELKLGIHIRANLISAVENIIGQRDWAWEQLRDIDERMSAINVPTEMPIDILGYRQMSTLERVEALIRDSNAHAAYIAPQSSEEDKGMEALVAIHNNTIKAKLPVPAEDYCQQCGMVTYSVGGLCVHCGSSAPVAVTSVEQEASNVTITIIESPEDLIKCPCCGRMKTRAEFHKAGWNGRHCANCAPF